MLQRSGVEFAGFGARVGRGRVRKVAHLVSRARDLRRVFADTGAPDVLVAASRSAAVAARRLEIPSFIIGDYEYASMSIYRLTGSTILHPAAIDGAVFRRHGLRTDQVRAFAGLKEDLTFADVDVDAVVPYDLGDTPIDAVRVLFRPPSETSHYYRRKSSAMARMALAHLARAGALVVLAPREPEQVAYLQEHVWAHPPVVLDRPAPFVALLKSVDAVVCSGGTMLREAAFLGVPAYSIFKSRIGGVDRWLEELGRVTLLRSPADLERLEIRRRGPLSRLDSNPRLLQELTDIVVMGAAVTRHARRHGMTARATRRRLASGPS
jgi:predicted glycosyltransferase